ncbi:MAG: TonB-dependent receptor [Bacteroidota bacterium]|nr:TonB-dependent receptor [Bacteroidota bacterium]
MHRILALCAFTMLATLPASAQQSVSILAGQVVTGDPAAPMPGLNVRLRDVADSTAIIGGTVTDSNGNFALRVSEQGTYELVFSFVGFAPVTQTVDVNAPYRQLGTIIMQPQAVQIGEVVVEGAQERMRIVGDTTIFNADAYKVNPDASAEDLIAKMPGIVVTNGQVEAQGEQVQRVTVDGREFFGDDPTAALRNLPADIIQSVEVFDRESDQAQFTGFDDGNQQKAINVVTRSGMSNGQFGKVYGGYGDETRYITGGNTNIFDDARRISIIGLSNNINQQNFAMQDLMGLMGGGTRGGSMRGGSGMRGGGSNRGGGRSRGGGFSPRSFMVGQQGGLNSTTSVGMNYSDEIGAKVEMSASYFFNRVGNENSSLLNRELFLAGDQAQLYNESSQSSSKNFNHRLNGRVEYQINENNSLIIRPSFSFQDNRSASYQNGQNNLNTGLLLNTALNDYASDNLGYTSSSSILYRHRFGTPGRTISADLRVGLNSRWGDTDQLSETVFMDESTSRGGQPSRDELYDQNINNKSAGQSYSLRIAYTEPVGEDGQLQLTYRPSLGRNVSDRSSYMRDLVTGAYTILDPTFSSLFDNDVYTHRGGVSYQINATEVLEIQLGLEAQTERLLGDQTYPAAFTLDRSFLSLLPEAEVEFEFGEALDLEIDYRTRTNTPSVSQLQDVIDNTNPLFLSTGNPDLEPSYAHSIRLRARRGNWRAGRMVFAFVDLTRETNSIGTASLLATENTRIDDRILLQQGAQFSYPINLKDPSLSVRSFMGIGTPFPLLKSNLNFRGGLTWTRSPGLINGTDNMSRQYSYNGGLTLGSNISERLDFTLTYNSSYTVASNSFYTALDEHYYRHDFGFQFTWLPLGGLIIENNVTYNDYIGLDETLYPKTFIVNAGIGYKFLRQDVAEIKLVVGDIFNQETGIRRSITETYIEDSEQQVLGRYLLLNLSYRFRNFGL